MAASARRWFRGVAPKGVLLIATLTITLVIAEAIARRVAPRAMMVPWQDDLHGVTALPLSLTGRLAFPGQFDTTITVHDRFRSPRPVARQPTAGSIRSHARRQLDVWFGSEDDETYPAALEPSVERTPAPRPAWRPSKSSMPA
jgi:hypothetical protein